MLKKENQKNNRQNVHPGMPTSYVWSYDDGKYDVVHQTEFMSLKGQASG